MLKISNQQLSDSLSYEALIPVLETAFAANNTTPLRHHHNFENPIAEKFSTLLLMPSWDNEKYLGVKMVTISPENSKRNLPSIQGVYFLFDLQNGTPILQCDARLLTVKRTAAASALASKYLSQKNANQLLMIGTGYLAPHLIEAHVAIRAIKKVQVWGRDFTKAKQLVTQFEKADFEVEAIENLQMAIESADIISSATMSKKPLIKGEWLRAGQHIDLVGSYLPTHREADDEVIGRSEIFVDNFEGTMKESGDIYLPLQSGVLTREDIHNDLFEMCKSESHYFRKTEDEITLFKSVGHALEDLAAASLVYEKIKAKA